MKRILLFVVWIALNTSNIFGQQPGDTIVVSAFSYTSSVRDTVLTFPSGNISFEKVIMKYSMRCKNGLVSTQSAPNQGCGEWDYSCNTFIVDSSKIEEVLQTHPSHTISHFTGTNFPYRLAPIYDYYRFRQYHVEVDSIIQETQTLVGQGVAQAGHVLKTDERSGKSQVLYTAAELLAAGFSAGAIDGIRLEVANSGGTAHFLKIGIMHTSASSLSASTVALSGFTTVYNNTYSFSQGSNRIQFYTPFLWDGTSNLLIEFSFTNTIPGNPVVLVGNTTPHISSLSANNNYALDFSGSGLVYLDSTYFNSISNQFSLGFWAYGYADLPVNTTIAYGFAGLSNQRQVNVHLPWGNGNVVFDCGFSGGYDRIEKAALPQEMKGQWNHWVFTKNAATGNMSIYLNGNLWQSGTGKTKAISLKQMFLGNNPSRTANYKGKINQLSVWDKALSLTEIQAYKNKPLDASHTSYANLLAYYKMDEGVGLTLVDSRHQLASVGSDFLWTYERGDALRLVFNEMSTRPAIALLRGTYILDTTLVYAIDSLRRNPNIVKEYAIVLATPGVLKDDSLALISSHLYYHATPQRIMDGDMDTLISTIPLVADDSIQVNTLNYYKRFPYYNEIMSFVTPYGKGLNLGINGKSWFFDVSDFMPLLKGKKRIMMTGGIYQEDMDIDFLFIVGTPPRNILAFEQLWQGSARAGEASISGIVNNVRYPPVVAPLLTSGQAFKIRATITGHGSEGEFHQNGGIVNHYFLVNSSTNSFSWQITEECSMNPVFPQGGTWVYDRQGWCPGQYSLTKELDITPLVTPGTNASLDYNCSPPMNPSGDYRYIAAFQLVTYGGPNHNLDAHVVDVLAPSDKVVYSRKNPICANPVVLVQNTGANPVTKLEISYWLNNATTKQTYTWTGNLGYMDTTRIMLPTAGLWDHAFQTTNNIFHVSLDKVNDVDDNYPYNNVYRSPFTLTEKIPQNIVVEFKTNNYPFQNSYKIYDENGNILPGTSSLSTANTMYRDTFHLNGCYTLEVWDTGGDGIQWWANPNQGTGYMILRDMSGNIFKTFQPDFGGGFTYSFTTLDPTSIEEHLPDFEVEVYPNPAQGQLMISGKDLHMATVDMQDMLGRRLDIPMHLRNNIMEININALTTGTYFISIRKGDQRVVKKVMVR